MKPRKHGSPGAQEGRPAAREPEGLLFGEIKWFGGANSKTGRENDFGFIASAAEDVFFHRSGIQSSPELLVPGARVIFERGRDAKGRPAAVAVRPLVAIPDAELVALLRGPPQIPAEGALMIAVARGSLSPCENEVLDAVSALSATGRYPPVLGEFWERFPPSSPLDPLFGPAPNRVKRLVCRAHYSAFRDALGKLFSPFADVDTSLSARAIYDGLDEEDIKLARSWTKGDSEGSLAKMLSARAAEKAVKRLFEGIGASVVDVSISQLDGRAGDWLTHDLVVNSDAAIDVKNARRPLNSKKFYVEHTIPKFKSDRTGNGVRIAAVLSPYLRLNQIEKPQSIGLLDDLVFLGETTRDDIARMRSLFNSPTFQVTSSQQRTFPHWAFSYPEAWYGGYWAAIERTLACEWPNDEEWEYVLDEAERPGAIPALCVLGKALPEPIASQLSDWQLGFYARLQAMVGSGPPHLPTIFFAVLTDFLDALRERRVDFSPADYSPLLYASNGSKGPLGAIDPLELVGGLVKTLKTLWAHRADTRLESFSSFRFGGLGILQGRETEGHEWTTILAYCGGTVYQTGEDGTAVLSADGQPIPMSKCGHAPLVIGRNRTCPACRKLLCDKCGFCSLPCEERSRGHVRDQENTRHARAKTIAPKTQVDTGHDGPRWEQIPLEAYEDEFRRG
jgi:cold shock CspA family protein